MRFEEELRGQFGIKNYPWSIFIPNGLGNLISVLGGTILLLPMLRPGRDVRVWLIIGIAMVAVLIPVLLSVRYDARFHMEPLTWMLLAIATRPNQMKIWVMTGYRYVFSVQALASLSILAFGVATLSPGALTPAWRQLVMTRTAEGYAAFKWVDDVLPTGAVLVTTISRIALAPPGALAMDWTDYVDVRSKEAIPYLEYIRDKGATHHIHAEGLVGHTKLDGCLGKLVAGPFEARIATRNPFNRGKPFQAYIHELRSKDLPSCVQAVKP